MHDGVIQGSPAEEQEEVRDFLPGSGGLSW